MDGVSLTVNGVMDFGFEVMIIPITYSRTIMKDYGQGSKVNIEVDFMESMWRNLFRFILIEIFRIWILIILGGFMSGLGVGSLLVYCEERIDCRWMV